MSNLSQFFSSGGNSIPLGGVLGISGASASYVEGNLEYLKFGSWKSIVGYEALATAAPGAVFITGTLGKNVLAARTVRKNTVWYLISDAYAAWSATLDGTFGTVTFSNALYDVVSFNGVIVIWSNSPTNSRYLQGTASYDLPTTALRYCGATNSTGTLGVAFNSFNGGAGSSTSSTDGTTWTNRTPTNIVSSGAAVAAVWSPVSNNFVVCTTAGNLVTTADAITCTNRGIPSGLTLINITPAGRPASDYVAASAGVTLISVWGTYQGVANTPLLIRTVDGVTFTATPFTALGMDVYGSRVGLMYDGIHFYASAHDNPRTYSATVWRSVDGLTWEIAPRLLDPLVASTVLSGNLYYINNTYINMPTTSGSPVFTSSLTPTHVGVPVISYQVQMATTTALIQNYLRIK
jgi:hypothetical protein